MKKILFRLGILISMVISLYCMFYVIVEFEVAEQWWGFPTICINFFGIIAGVVALHHAEAILQEISDAKKER